MSIIMFTVGVILWAISEFWGNDLYRPAKAYISDLFQKISAYFKSFLRKAHDTISNSKDNFGE